MHPIPIDAGHYWVLFRDEPTPRVGLLDDFYPWRILGESEACTWNDITQVLDVIRPPVGWGQAVTIHWLKTSNFRLDAMPHTAESEDDALRIISEMIGSRVRTGGWTNYVVDGFALCNVYDTNENPPVVIPDQGFRSWDPEPVARLSCPITKDPGSHKPMAIRIQAEKMTTTNQPAPPNYKLAPEA